MKYNNVITQVVKKELTALYMSSYAIAEEMAALSERLGGNNQLKEATIDMFLKNVNEMLKPEDMSIHIISLEVPLSQMDPSFPLFHYHIQLEAQGRIIASQDCGICFMAEERYEKIVKYLDKAQAFSSTIATLDEIEKLIEFKESCGGI